MLTGTQNFTLSEVSSDTEWPIPAQYQDNAQGTLERLEVVRAILGVPLILTSLYRSPAANAATATAAQDSEHLEARAADFEPEGLDAATVSQLWLQAVANGQAPDFDQFIVELAADGSGAHVHFGWGGQSRMESLVRLATGAYQDLTGWVSSVADLVAQGVTSAASAAVSGATAVGVSIEQNPGISIGALGVTLLLGFRRVVAVARACRRGITRAMLRLLHTYSPYIFS